MAWLRRLGARRHSQDDVDAPVARRMQNLDNMLMGIDDEHDEGPGEASGLLRYAPAPCRILAVRWHGRRGMLAS